MQNPRNKGNFASRYLVDLRPLRTSREFAWLWSGQLISEIGSWVSTTLVYIQVFRLSDGSNIATGAVGLVQLAPILATSVGLGFLIDTFDRRRVLQVATVLQLLAAIALAVNAGVGPNALWVVYLATAISAGAGGMAHSARLAILPTLVPEEMLTGAISLNQAMWNTALIVGPALGGMIAGASLSLGYSLDVITFVAAFIGISALRPRPGHIPKEPSSSPQILSGLKFVRGQRVLIGSFGIDLVAMTFGMPRALFPALAASRFDVGERAVGYLLAAVSVGALVGSITSGWTRRIRRQGVAVVISVVVWGAAIAAFGISGPSLWLAMALLALAGAADVISAVFRGSILQRRIPESLRGRISGVHIAVVTGGPRLGDMESGVVASVWTPTGSVVSGGLACIVGAGIVAVALPDFWNECTSDTN